MGFTYILLTLAIFLPIPLLVYGFMGFRPGRGELLGGLLFMTTEILWFGLAQARGCINYDATRVLSVRWLNLLPGDIVMMAVIYFNCIAIHRLLGKLR